MVVFTTNHNNLFVLTSPIEGRYINGESFVTLRIVSDESEINWALENLSETEIDSVELLAVNKAADIDNQKVISKRINESFEKIKTAERTVEKITEKNTNIREDLHILGERVYKTLDALKDIEDTATYGRLSIEVLPEDYWAPERLHIVVALEGSTSLSFDFHPSVGLKRIGGTKEFNLSSESEALDILVTALGEID